MRPRISILIHRFVAFVTSFGAHVVAVNLLAYDEQGGVGVACTFKEIGDMLGPLPIERVSEESGPTVGFVACGILGLLMVGWGSRRAARPPAAAAGDLATN